MSNSPFRWAFNGVEFMLHAASPNFTRHLTADEFNEFKSAVEACYGHIIGEEESGEGGGGGGSSSRPGSSSRSPRTPVSPGEEEEEALLAYYLVHNDNSSPGSGPTSFSRSNSHSRGSRPTSPSGRRTPGTTDELAASGDSERLAKLQMPPPTSPFV